MAAPEYFIKLKFGTEIDQQQFQQLQNAFNNLTDKQKRTFARSYNTSVKEMNQLFAKNTESQLREYERAAIKTEQTISSARIKELRQYVTKRNQLMKTLPAYAGGAIAAGGVKVANSAINSSFNMTSDEKLYLTSAINGIATGAGAGAAVGSIIPGLGTAIGAGVGAAIGGLTGVISAVFEDAADDIKQSAQLFSSASQAYVAAINKTEGVYGGMYAAGFTDPAQYLVYQQALKNMDIGSDSFVDLVARSLASNKRTAAIGEQLYGMRRDAAMNYLYEMYSKSGMSAREFALQSIDKGGLGMSPRQAGNVIAMLEQGGLQKAISNVVAYQNIPIGQDVSILTKGIQGANKRRIDLANQDFASWMDNMRNMTEQGISMNNEIIEEGNIAWARNVDAMKESAVLLEGIKLQFKLHKEELADIFSTITGKTGVKTTVATKRAQKTQVAVDLMSQGDFNAAMNYLNNTNNMSLIPDNLYNKTNDATSAINNTRAQNQSTPIGKF